MTWKIVLEPTGNNDGKNTGGMVVHVESDNGAREEVSAVRFIRRNSKHKSVSYARQLQKEIKRAEETIKALNTKRGEQ